MVGDVISQKLSNAINQDFFLIGSYWTFARHRLRSIDFRIFNNVISGKHDCILCQSQWYIRKKTLCMKQMLKAD